MFIDPIHNYDTANAFIISYPFVGGCASYPYPFLFFFKHEDLGSAPSLQAP